MDQQLRLLSSDLPEGTVTFLFTDIAGSTQLLHQLRDKYKELLLGHHRIVRQVIERWGGREVSTEGDAFFVSFTRATEAVSAVVEIQRALAGHSWPEGVTVGVRMGLHTGEPWILETDYAGIDVHRASRIANAGHGGQVLLSETTTPLVWDELPEGVQLLDLGRHRLKDMRRPEPIHQLVIEGLPAEFQPLRSLEALPAVQPDYIRDAPISAPRKVGPSPYRGLAAFRENDAELFFGREAFVAQMSEAVGKRELVAVVVGPSGSGKSSAVFAGLLPQMREAGKWLIVETRPGSQPFQALAGAFVPHLEKGIGETELLVESGRLARAMRAGELSLYHVASRAVALNAEAERCLLVIDQFEELFTHRPDPDDQRLFLDELIAAAETAATYRPSPLVLLLTLRADFMGQALGHRPFADALQEGSLILGPMNRAELQMAVERPAELAGAAFETGLVQRILDDVGGEPGNLPLLEFALTLLWESMEEGWMTHTAYEEIGRVDGALARYAEEVWLDLDEGEQEAARPLFVQLVQPGEGTEDTRRVARRNELAPEHWQLVQHLADRRLVVTGRDDAGQETVEVVHEALIRGWERLRLWMQADRAFRTWQEGLRVAQRGWEASGRDDGALLRGAPLALALEWAAENGAALGPLEIAFIDASRQESQRREAQREARRQRELETAQKLAEAERARAEEQATAAQDLRRRAYILSGVLVLAAVLAIAAVFFARQSDENAREAEESASLATTREAEAEQQRSVAEIESEQRATAQANAEDERQRADEQREAAQMAEVQAQEQKVIAEEQRAAAEDEARAALEAYSQSLAGHVDNVLENKDTATALALAMEASALEAPPAFSQRMLRQAAYAPGPRRQFQVSELFPGVTGRIYSLAMSPVVQEALIGFEDGNLILWDVSTESEIRRLKGHDGTVRAAAFSPDGQTALSGGSDHLVILWDLETGRELRRFEGHDGWVRTVAFSPDGGTAVSGGFAGESVSSVVDPGQLILWDLASGAEVRRFGGEADGHPSGVVAASFTPDGRAILASSGFFANVDNEYSLILWDASTGQKIRDFEITGQNDNFSLAISPDGHTALTGNSTDEVVLWDMETGQRTQTLKEHTGQNVTSVAFTADGRRALSGDANGMVILWDLASGEALMRTVVQAPSLGGWHAYDSPVLNIVTSPDGRIALSSAGDGTLVLWDLVNAGEIRRFEGHQTPELLSVAFTPDGKRVLTGEWGDAFGFPFGESNSMRLWDVETGEQLRSFEGHTGGIIMIAASADGRQALTGSADGTIRLWDLQTGEEKVQILAHSGGVMSVAISQDGRMALSGSLTGAEADSGITIWDLESGQIIHRLASEGNYTSLWFNPDGQTAYTELYNEDISEWAFAQYNIESGQLVRRYDSPGCCTGFAVHPDGRSVFLANNNGGPVFEWDLEADREIRAFGQHSGSRTRVEVSPDGRRLLISAFNFAGGILSLWDLDTGLEIRRFVSEGYCCIDIDMSPDGTMAVTPGGGGTAILWDLTLPVEMDDVRAWIGDNRYVRELSCEERDNYLIKPLCESS